MNYHILNAAGDKIASFENESDRDLCLDTFVAVYFDCKFDIKDDE